MLHSNDRLLRAPPTTYGRPKHDHSTLTSDALDASDAVFRQTKVTFEVMGPVDPIGKNVSTLVSPTNTVKRCAAAMSGDGGGCSLFRNYFWICCLFTITLPPREAVSYTHLTLPTILRV